MQLGAYRLEEAIGKGGMGVVWAATLAGGGRVAVKLLTLRRARDERFRRSLWREARTIARLDHPHIVGLHDVGVVGADQATEGIPAGAPYLVMDLVQGVSLHRHRGQLGWHRLREVLLGLLGALGHAHSRGVIHGDLKPSNVMVDGEGVRLTDFGVARVAGPGGWGPSERPNGGTPSYMAPELLTGDWRDVGPWTDLFGLGCLAWSLACGRPPHHAGNRYEVIRAQLTDPLPRFAPTQPVPPRLEGWLRRLLAREPGRRFQRAADAAWELLALPDEVEGEAHPVELEPDRPRTTVFWTDVDLSSTPARAARERRGPTVEAVLAPIPSSWRSLPDLGSIARRHAGTGLGLLGIRPPPMVAREGERDVLWQALRVAAGKTARAVVLTGPSGAGQGRLARWLVERSHEVGAAEVLVSRGGDGAQALPAAVERALVAEGLEREALAARLAEQAPERSDDDRRRLVALLRPGLFRDLFRFETVEARRALWVRWLRWLAAGRVLVWWIDDAERAPEALALAVHLLERWPDLPVLVVVTATDDALEGQPDAQRRLAALRASPATTVCEVGPMPTHALHTLVHETLGLEAGLADEVARRAHGNPRYALEVMREAAAGGHLEPGPTGYRLTEGAVLRLPRTQRDLWAQALALALSAQASVHVAELGAVLGERIDPDEWAAAARVAGLPSPLPVADALVRARLLVAEGRAYRFAHAMVHGALLEQAATEGRLAGHHAVSAELLARQGAGPARVGRHLLGAGRRDEGVELLLEGAELAMANGALSEARALLRERDDALAGAGEVPTGPARVRGHRLLARALVEMGQPLAAEAVLAQVPDDADIAPVRGRAAFELGRYPEAEASFRLALSAHPAEAHLGLASVAVEQGDAAEAERCAVEAVRIAQDAGDAFCAAQALTRVGLARIAGGRIEGAMAPLEDALERFQALEYRTGQARALRQLAMVRHMLGEHQAAREAYHEALEHFLHGGDLLGARHAHNGLGDLDRELGDMESAERSYRRAVASARQAGVDEAERIPQLNLALTLLEQGRLGPAAEILEDAATALRAQGRRGILGVVLVVRAALAAHSGRLAAARADLAEGEALLEATGRIEPDAARWAAWLAEAFDDPEDAARARALAARQWNRLGRHDEAERLRAGR